MKRRALHGKKLLVATAGLATITILGCTKKEPPVGNLVAPPPTEIPVGNLVAPPPTTTPTVDPLGPPRADAGSGPIAPLPSDSGRFAQPPPKK